MIRYRTAESVKRKIDAMLKKGTVILDHGVSSYLFDHYDYVYPCYQNKFTSQLHIYYRELNGDVKHYMTVSENNLRKPNENDWYVELVTCSWDKEFPTLLEMREYLVR